MGTPNAPEWPIQTFLEYGRSDIGCLSLGGLGYLGFQGLLCSGFFTFFCAILLSGQAGADERVRLGKARIFNNDYFGDNQDRWRTGSYAVSYLKGPEWQGQLPGKFGDLLEYRFRSEIIAPTDLSNPVIGTDRPYVGALSFGLATHLNRGGNDLSLGVDLMVTGPQTGMGEFHTWAHNLYGGGAPAVLGSQIGDGIHPTVSAELGRAIPLSQSDGGHFVLRPFVQAQAGVETYVRVGADFTIGRLGRGGLRVRDVVTGQRVSAIQGQDNTGLSFVAGADAAYVASSVYLPTSSGYNLTDLRLRARAGVSYVGEKSSIFYGLTWLGREFVAQPESQVVGSLSIKLRF